MRIIFAILGLFFFGLGALGAVLPVLPTTPFLLLASFFFLRSSKRLNDWFLQTKLYKRYLANFVENREMTLRTKLLCCAPGVIIMSVLAFMLPMIWAKVALIALVIFELWYFKMRIKTIPTDVARAQGEARLKQNEPIS